MLNREAGAEAYSRKFANTYSYFPKLGKWLYVKDYGSTENYEAALIAYDEHNNVIYCQEDPDYIRIPSGFYLHNNILYFIKRNTHKSWKIGITFGETHQCYVLSGIHAFKPYNFQVDPLKFSSLKKFSFDPKKELILLSELFLLTKNYLFFGNEIISIIKNNTISPMINLPKSITNKLNEYNITIV